MPWTRLEAQLPTPTIAILMPRGLGDSIGTSSGRNGQRARARRDGHWGVPRDHRRAEIGECLRIARRAGVMRLDTEMLRREAEGHRHLEIGESIHHPVEPVECAGAETVRPAQAGAK